MADTHYASVKNPTINEVIQGLARFTTLDDALHRLEVFREKFTAAGEKYDTDPEDKSFAVFWIKGYEVTEQERKKGYIGNYAKIFAEELYDQKFALSAEKLSIDVRFHPQKKREKHPHPNWGHPTLRRVKNGRPWSTEKDAYVALRDLRNDYEKACILNRERKRLFISIFEGQRRPPIQKYVFQVTEKNDKYYIEYWENREDSRFTSLKVDEVYDNLSIIGTQRFLNSSEAAQSFLSLDEPNE